MKNTILSLQVSLEKLSAAQVTESEERRKNETSLANGINGAIQSLNDLSKRYQALEASLTSTLNILDAVIKVAEGKGLLSGYDVMVKVRETSEANEQREVAAMLEHGLITAKETVESGDLVFVSETLKLDSGEVKTLSNYRRIDLSSAGTPENVVKMILGRKVGEEIETVLPDNKGTYVTKLVAAYCLSEKTVSGTNNKEQEADGTEQKGV
jgi:hypothetical protein